MAGYVARPSWLRFAEGDVSTAPGATSEPLASSTGRERRKHFNTSRRVAVFGTEGYRGGSSSSNYHLHGARGSTVDTFVFTSREKWHQNNTSRRDTVFGTGYGVGPGGSIGQDPASSGGHVRPLPHLGVQIQKSLVQRSLSGQQGNHHLRPLPTPSASEAGGCRRRQP